MALVGSKNTLSASKVDVFPAVAYSWLSCLRASPRTVIAHLDIEDFLCRQKLNRFEPIALFGFFCIQVHKLLVSTSFKAAGAVNLISEVVLERGEQERPKFTFEPVNARKRPVFQ